MTPYVGITGFTAPSEAEQLLGYFAGLSFSTPRKLMCGVLASYASLNGQDMKPEWRYKYPTPGQINQIFQDDPLALNLIHYNSKQPGLGDQLEQLLELAPRCQGFQLNIAWPNPKDVQRFRKVHPDLVIVLQISTRAMTQIRFDPYRANHSQILREQLESYGEDIDFYLPDLSGGRGVELETERMALILAGQAVWHDSLQPVAAGGLDASNLSDLLATILQLHPNLSWDAEGRLFNGDVLDLDCCRRYLKASVALCR